MGSGIGYSSGGHQQYAKDKEFTILHRLDGPAVKWVDGPMYWYANGKFHRLDGPAIEGVDGWKEWYVNGKAYSEKDFNRLFGRYKDATDKQIAADIDTMFE